MPPSPIDIGILSGDDSLSPHGNGHTNGHYSSLLSDATDVHQYDMAVDSNGIHHTKKPNTNGAGGAYSDSFEGGGIYGSFAPPPVAIVGMALRLPGGVKTTEQFWELLVNKRDGRCPIPNNRYNSDAFYGPRRKPGEVSAQHGYFLQDDLEYLDAGFFSMSKAEIAEMDPQQRLLLEVVHECMESAGQTRWRGRDIGCYVGVFGEDWLDLSTKDTQHTGFYRITGTGDFAISNRISYEYDLKGPSMTIRTGCSSALVGLHEACQALYNGQCSSAIVAGTNLILSPTMTIAMTMQGVLSPTGSCKTFDAAADGYARGEAINAILIKPLDAALRDGDPIRAVIRSTATNCDGKTPGIAYPSSEAHENMIRLAYQTAQLPDIARTAYFECHGTGTAVGDPLETVAIANVLNGKGVVIGSVKPNVGHSEGASGITSLIKAVLALEHRVIPPNINFSVPNPKIPMEKAKLKVPLEPTAWPEGRHERASVNSFGIGGANAHVILDSAASFLPDFHSSRNSTVERGSSHNLLVFSANSPDSLRRNASAIQQYINSYPDTVSDISYNLSVRRDHLPHRAFSVIKESGQELHISNFVKARRTAPSVHYVFTGQGAQWAGMGYDLMSAFPEFKKDILGMDKTLQALPDGPEWTIHDELAKIGKQAMIDKAEFSQPLCTAVQVGLVNLLNQWGVTPAGVLGHSSGEIAAAYAAQAITQGEAIIIAYYRGQVTKLQTRSGGMAAIGLGREAVLPFLTKGVGIACENSPRSVTLSGDVEQLGKVIEEIKAQLPDTFCRRLRVEMAYHSHHMFDLGETYERLMTPHVQSRAPAVPFYSSVHGKVVSNSGSLDPSYWRQNMEQPVLFHTAVRAVLSHALNDTLFLEIGPHSALAGPLRQIFQDAAVKIETPYVPTLVRNQDQVISILSSMGQLFQHAVPIDFAAINGQGRVLTNLPPYSWQHDTKYWNESRVTKAWRLRQFSKHELLGSRMLESSDLEPSWRNVLRLEDVPWLRDHKIIEDIVFPCAGYIATAGEAIRQITGSSTYTVRRLVVKSALVLRDTTTTELITSFKAAKLTDSLESDWYDFTISSYDGSAWIKHCVGQARPSWSNQPRAAIELARLPRAVNTFTWYRAMRELGLNYGPRFQGLYDISAHPVQNRAVARVVDDKSLHESSYSVHPTAIDQVLQLFTVAMSSGLSRKLDKLAIPAAVDEILITETNTDLLVEVAASVTPKGAVHGKAMATSAGAPAILLNGGIFAPLETDANHDEGIDSLAAARLEWKPHVEFLPVQNLIRRRRSKREGVLLIEKLAWLCMIETARLSAAIEPVTKHMSKFKSWVIAQVARLSDGKEELLHNAATWPALSTSERLGLIEDTISRVSTWEGGSSVASVVRRILEHSKALFVGEMDPMGLLVQNDGLTHLYSFYQEMVDFSEFFSLLGHAKPILRVLEIGAGTGGSTIGVLKALKSQSGVRMFSKYTFTDISAGFFPAAQERFKDFAGIQYSVLDISTDPLSQGFEAESYDLIIASNVLHATPSLQDTLQNVRKLLAPQGKLFLQELCPEMRWINYVMGILPGWWLGEADGRSDEPYISPSRWNEELHHAGFQGAENVVFDDEQPYQMNANIITTLQASDSAGAIKQVTLLVEPEVTDMVQRVQSVFEHQGYTVHISNLNECSRPPGDVIALLDLNIPFFANMSKEKLESFQKYLKECQAASASLLWVMKPAQINCEDPRYGLTLGMIRTIRSELLLDFATFEVDNFGPGFENHLMSLYQTFQRSTSEGELNNDFEYSLANGVIQVGRFHWLSAKEELAAKPNLAMPLKLGIEKYGLLNTLSWSNSHLPGALMGDQVEVIMKYVGLNFKDVLVSMGVVDGPKDRLGLEGSGVVSRVGPSAAGLKVGDRVFVSDLGCFSTRMVTTSKLCVRIPDSLSFEEAATMPCVYSTVIHSLVNIGRIERGQTVLIQSACGGVGIAALHVCQTMGAEIYATVGNEEKIEYLVKNFGIPRNRIFDSRSTSFLPDLLRETNGRGVDLVLNSLSGELLHASWKCVAKFGKMLEIGKRDFIGHAELAMDIFEANRSFFGIDLAQLAAERPEACRRLLEQCLTLYDLGGIQPIRPIKVFDAKNMAEAFRYMQKGQHIGKIVVKIPDSPSDLPAASTSKPLSFSPDKSYLLVGGLGGLGRAISNWMVERGARNLVYLSRSAGKSADDQAFFCELEAQGCRTLAVPGSVASVEDVQRTVAESHTPIAGVIQMSMVLRDQSLLDLSHLDWTTALSPKVEGTWNLHNALETTNLDFFLLFSSVSGTVGQWGQANYAAANTFLDSFVQYRHSLGLPASVIDIGPIDGIGYVSQNVAVLDVFKSSSTHLMRENDLLNAVQIAILDSAPTAPTKNSYCERGHLTTGIKSTKKITDPSNRTIWKRDIRMAMYRNLEVTDVSASGSRSDGLKIFLAGVVAQPDILKSQESLDFLTVEIGQRISSYMMQSDEEIDTARSLADIGVDSLVSIEIRNWWQRSLGLEISVLEIMNAGTIQRLGVVAVEGLKAKYKAGEATTNGDSRLLMKAA